jgi:hypothetical protein
MNLFQEVPADRAKRLIKDLGSLVRKFEKKLNAAEGRELRLRAALLHESIYSEDPSTKHNARVALRRAR